MKRHAAVLELVIGIALCVLPMQAQPKTHRVLFALTSPEEADWQLTVNNVRNLISGMGPEPVEIEIVAYGPGISEERLPGCGRYPKAGIEPYTLRGLRHCNEEAAP